MPGLGRSHTSYDVYRGYDQDQLMEEMYPTGGAISPAPLDGEATYPPMDAGRMTPADGRYTPVANGRRSPTRSKTRLLGRPPSRVNTESPRYYPEGPMRPTSPVQRLLARSVTQPYVDLQATAGADMDPFTRQYYHRKWKSEIPSTDVMLNRHGRAGGVWRHVRACTANTGTHITFIDGTVKQEDNIFFPVCQKPDTHRSYDGLPVTVARYPNHRMLPKQQKSHDSVYSKHARNGFKYWYQEPKPIDLKARLRLKARQVGLGY